MICGDCILFGEHKSHNFKQVKNLKEEIKEKIEKLDNESNRLENSYSFLYNIKDIDCLKKVNLKKNDFFQIVREKFDFLKGLLNLKKQKIEEEIDQKFFRLEDPLSLIDNSIKNIFKKEEEMVLKKKKILEELNKKNSNFNFLDKNLYGDFSIIDNQNSIYTEYLKINNFKQDLIKELENLKIDMDHNFVNLIKEYLIKVKNQESYNSDSLIDEDDCSDILNIEIHEKPYSEELSPKSESIQPEEEDIIIIKKKKNLKKFTNLLEMDNSEESNNKDNIKFTNFLENEISDEEDIQNKDNLKFTNFLENEISDKEENKKTKNKKNIKFTNFLENQNSEEEKLKIENKSDIRSRSFLKSRNSFVINLNEISKSPAKRDSANYIIGLSQRNIRLNKNRIQQIKNERRATDFGSLNKSNFIRQFNNSGLGSPRLERSFFNQPPKKKINSDRVKLKLIQKKINSEKFNLTKRKSTSHYNITKYNIISKKKILDYSNQNLHDDILENVIETINSFNYIKTLDLSDNFLTHEGLDKLLKNIYTHPSLEKLILKSNYLNDKLFNVLEKYISKLTKLKIFNFKNNKGNINRKNIRSRIIYFKKFNIKIQC